MDAGTREACGSGASVRIMPETWAGRVSNFIRAASPLPPANSDSRPDLVFGRLARLGSHDYAGFIIRSRHFRCLRTFLVETGPGDEIESVIELDGLRSKHRIAQVELLVSRLPTSDRSSRLTALLDGTLETAARYANVQRLRFSYIHDSSLGEPVGTHVSPLLLEPPLGSPFVEEARVPHETGRGHEAVLLAFNGSRGVR
jgi:hypothetical protein